MLECFWCICDELFVIDLVSYHSVWTDHHTFTALDTEIRHPHWDFQSDITFLPLSRSSWECSINRECRDGEIIAIRADDFSKHIADKFRRLIRDRLSARDLGSDLRWDLDLMKILECAIHRFKIFLHDRFTALAI